jgi:hypothetical protein
MVDFMVKACLFVPLLGVGVVYTQSGRPFIPSRSRRFFDGLIVFAVFVVSMGVYVLGLRAYVPVASSIHDAELRAFAVSLVAAAIGALIGLVGAAIRHRLFRRF